MFSFQQARSQSNNNRYPREGSSSEQRKPRLSGNCDSATTGSSEKDRESPKQLAFNNFMKHEVDPGKNEKVHALKGLMKITNDEELDPRLLTMR